MGIETTMLVQTAVYWAPAAPDRFGAPTYATPVEISVRWEQVSEEFKDSAGETKISNAKIFTGIDVLTDGLLLLSALSSSVVQATPFDNDEVWEIKKFEKLPFLRSTTRFLRTVFV